MTKRLTILAGYDKQSIIDPYVKTIIKDLKKNSSKVIAVFDFENTRNLKPEKGVETIFKKHGEYDFGSWKIGLESVKKELKNYDELVLVNDSCFPMGGLKPVFSKMKSKKCDWWGLYQVSHNGFSAYNISFFQVFKKQVFNNKYFLDFFKNVKKQPSIKEVVKEYEVGLSHFLRKKGLEYKSYVPKLFTQDPVNGKDALRDAIKYEVPMIKKRMFVENHLGVSRLWKKVESAENRMQDNYIVKHIKRVYGEIPNHWFLRWSGFSTPLWLRPLCQIKGKYSRSMKWFKIRFKLIGMTFFILPFPVHFLKKRRKK